MYVDKGASDLLQAMFDLGAKRRHLVAKLAGAASCVQGEHIFRIGERNHTMVRRVLWKNDILIAAEDVGGSRSRTVYLEVGTGEVLVKTGGRTRPLDWTREVFR